MVEARVFGRAASLADAVMEAAQCLGKARFPVIAGLGSDVAGVRGAIALARRLRGAFDHLAADAVLRDLSVMQRGGWMCVSPAEVARNCDVLLLVGVGDVDHLFAGRSPPPAIHIGTKEAATSLATLRAMILGTKSTQLAKRAQKHKSAVQQLKAAKYGVAVWQSGALDEPAVEMLMGLVRDLNQSSRFSALPLAAAGNANGANFISSWLTGFPVRTSFGQGQPEHDPWAFSAERMVVSGEADAALWLSAFDTALPEWVNRVPAVALVARGSRPNIWPNVLVEVGTPGIDHDGVFFRPETGALGFQASSQQTDVPRADQVLADILAALPSEVLAA